MSNLPPVVRPDDSVLVQGPNPEVQVVQLVNRTDRTWSDQYAKVTYTCEPGQRIFIPFHAMCYWFGHPDAMDVPGDRQRQYRLDEFRRLQVMYGTYDDLDAFYLARPNVELFTDLGERIVTVKDDPEGSHLTPAVQSTQQQELIARTLDSLQREVARLSAELAQSRGEEEAMAAADRIANDIPSASGPGPVEKGIPDLPMPGEKGVPGDVPTAPPTVTPPDDDEVTVDGPVVPKVNG